MTDMDWDKLSRLQSDLRLTSISHLRIADQEEWSDTDMTRILAGYALRFLDAFPAIRERVRELEAALEMHLVAFPVAIQRAEQAEQRVRELESENAELYVANVDCEKHVEQAEARLRAAERVVAFARTLPRPSDEEMERVQVPGLREFWDGLAAYDAGGDA